MQGQKFDGAAELAAIRQERGKRKKARLLKPSKLNVYRGEIFELHKNGASYADISYWLDTRKACPANKTTVMRFIKNNTV
jgi:hypothetical protein